MVKVDIEDKNEFSVDYPCLKRESSTGNIAFFVKYNSGVVVYSEDESHIGSYVYLTSDLTQYKPYTGKVTIENK